MEQERHAEILRMLNNPELTQTEKTDLLDELRNGTNALYHGIKTHEEKITELTTSVNDLTQANGKLFMKLSEEDSKEEEANKPPAVKPLSELLKGKEVDYNA